MDGIDLIKYKRSASYHDEHVKCNSNYVHCRDWFAFFILLLLNAEHSNESPSKELKKSKIKTGRGVLLSKALREVHFPIQSPLQFSICVHSLVRSESKEIKKIKLKYKMPNLC